MTKRDFVIELEEPYVLNGHVSWHELIYLLNIIDAEIARADLRHRTMAHALARVVLNTMVDERRTLSDYFNDLNRSAKIEDFLAQLKTRSIHVLASMVPMDLEPRTLESWQPAEPVISTNLRERVIKHWPTVGALADDLSVEDLKKQPNCGKATIEDIANALKQFQMRLFRRSRK